MSTESQMRNLIGDPFLYDRATATGDGTTLEYAIPNTPVRPDTQTVTVDGSAKVEVTDYTLNDALGLVTFLTAPATDKEVVITYEHSLLSDAQLTDFFSIEGDDLKLAAAAALDSIAATQALIQKKIKVLDLQTDGPALAKSLRDQAESLRKQAYLEPVFDLAEQINDAAGFREKVIKDNMREG